MGLVGTAEHRDLPGPDKSLVNPAGDPCTRLAMSIQAPANVLTSVMYTPNPVIVREKAWKRAKRPLSQRHPEKGDIYSHRCIMHPSGQGRARATSYDLSYARRKNMPDQFVWRLIQRKKESTPHKYALKMSGGLLNTVRCHPVPEPMRDRRR